SPQPGFPLLAGIEQSFAANAVVGASVMPGSWPAMGRGSSGCFGQARLFRMPPSSGDDHALRSDFTVAGQVLADDIDDIDVIEAALIDGQNGRVANAAGLETAELRSLQSECGVDGRRCDHIAQRHAETKELRHGGDLIE